MTIRSSLGYLNYISKVNRKLFIIDELALAKIWADAGKQVRVWRTVRNLSLRDTARLLNISKSLLSDVENGKRNPIYVIRKILAYGKSIHPKGFAHWTSRSENIGCRRSSR